MSNVSQALPGFSVFLLSGVYDCKAFNGLANGKESFKCSKDLQNLRSLEMFLARRVLPDSVKWGPILLKCLPWMLWLSRMSMFRSTKYMVSCLNVKNAFPLSILRVGVDGITSTSDILSIIFLFISRNLSNVSLEVDLAASFVSAFSE